MFASGACGGRPACELDDTLLTKVCAASPQFKLKLHKLGAQPDPADESGLKEWRHKSTRLLRDLVRSTLRFGGLTEQEVKLLHNGTELHRQVSAFASIVAERFGAGCLYVALAEAHEREIKARGGEITCRKWYMVVVVTVAEHFRVVDGASTLAADLSQLARHSALRIRANAHSLIWDVNAEGADACCAVALPA